MAAGLSCRLYLFDLSMISAQTRSAFVARENRYPLFRIMLYRFFHPPRCPGAPPVERGLGPNSGPDWRESVGWKILLPVLFARSSGAGLRGSARVGR
jgi:hypothetical protein